MLILCGKCEWILNLNGIETSFKKLLNKISKKKYQESLKIAEYQKNCFAWKVAVIFPWSPTHSSFSLQHEIEAE